MTEYERLYHRAEVRERWANIYAPDAFERDWMRLFAAQDRVSAEFIKSIRIEELANWLTRILKRGNAA